MKSLDKSKDQMECVGHIDKDLEYAKNKLESLIQRGKSIDPGDSASILRWMNATFSQLESYSSEHLSFRLHCLHTGLTLLSIALEKETGYAEEFSPDAPERNALPNRAEIRL